MDHKKIALGTHTKETECIEKYSKIDFFVFVPIWITKQNKNPIIKNNIIILFKNRQ